MTTATVTTQDRSNGLDLAALSGLLDLLQSSPSKARVSFGTHSRWQSGARVFTGVRGFRIDGEPVHEQERSFVLLSDEPTELGGTDAAPGPGEQLMHAMASCIAATTAANAAFMGVKLDGLSVEVRGELDLRGILGLADSVRPGFSNLTARIEITGDADEQTLQDIAARGVRFSPMRDSVQNGVPVRHQTLVG